MLTVFECQECSEEFESEHEIPWYARYPRLDEYEVDTVCPDCDLYQTFTLNPKEYS